MSDANGDTPLHLTCLPQFAFVKISTKLMEYGGNPNIRNASGDTLTDLAIKHNHCEILEEILKHGADLNSNNCRPLLLAINLHREQMVEQLLANGLDVTMKFPDGKTLFHQTILNVHVSLLIIMNPNFLLSRLFNKSMK